MTEFAFGIDTLLAGNRLRELRNKRVGLVAHPASVSSAGVHSLDALRQADVSIVRAFGPQHGLWGDKQDNMIESEDFIDPRHRIPVVSLYGTHRYPQPDMLADLDVLLFDLQDIGCRVYTYISTLRYFVAACADADVPLWILDRPNPVGRPIDGLYLEDGQQSFVGCDLLPMRHGLTVAELASWFADQLHVDCPPVLPMVGYDPTLAPGYGWPERPWINPSPNASSLNMTRCFAGTVLLEGTTLSEGRGTTTPLEVIGAPALPVAKLLSELQSGPQALLRACYFTPTFHKYEGELCEGIQIHTDSMGYQHNEFRPFRLIAELLWRFRRLQPEYKLWRHHEYEYEHGRIPIDVINGGSFFRDWVDNSESTLVELDDRLSATSSDWRRQREPYLLY